MLRNKMTDMMKTENRTGVKGGEAGKKDSESRDCKVAGVSVGGRIIREEKRLREREEERKRDGEELLEVYVKKIERVKVKEIKKRKAENAMRYSEMREKKR